MRILDRNWRCADGRDRHRRGRAPGAGRLRGQDPVRDQVRHPARGRSAGASGSGCAGWPSAGCARTACCSTRCAIDVIGLVRDRAGRLHHRARPGGGLNAGRPHPLDRPGRGRGPSGGGRGRHRERPARPAAGRPAGHGAARGQGPDPGGHRQQPRAVAAAPDHGRPVPGQPAQAGQRLRPRHRGRRSWARRARSRRPRSTASRSSASSGWTAGCARSAACCPRWPRPRGRRIPPGGRAAGQRRRGGAGARAAGGRRADPARAARLAARRASPPRRRWTRCQARRWCGRPAPGPPAARRPAPARRVPGPGPTWPTCSASRPPAGPRRSARPAATTCACSARRARARPCWPSGSRPSCPGSTAAAALEVTAIHSVAGVLPDRQPAADRAAVLRAAPHRDQGGDRRRGQRGHPARGGVPGPPRLPVPGRGAGVRPGRARRAAPAPGVGRGRDRPVGPDRPLPGPVHSGPGGQPVPVRQADRRAPVRAATARPRSAAGTWPGCPGRCWTGWT